MTRVAVVALATLATLVAASLPQSNGAAAIAAQQPQTAKAGPGEFVWLDLVTDNAAACRAFYTAMFGWTFASADGVDPGYLMIKHNDRPIGGMVTRRPGEINAGGAQWLAYVVVNDVGATAEAFRKAGGRVYRGPLNARRDLRVAAVADAQGAALGLASRGPFFQIPVNRELHEWLWMEYVAQDVDSALKFYGEVLGYKHEIAETNPNFTYYVLSTDRPRAGLFRSVWPKGDSAWLPYIRVNDPAAMALKAVQLGGTVVLPVSPRVRNNSLTVIQDPSGAVVALQKYPFDKGATE